MSAYRTFSRLGALLLLAGAAAVTGCGSGDGQSPPGPSALVGKTYLSTAVTGAQIPGGGPLEVAFPQAGRLTATAGCNRHMGEVTVDSDTMTAGALASTLMACPGPAGQADAWLSDFFAGPLSWQLTGDTLVLRQSRGTVSVTLTQRKDTPLTGTTWTVTSLVTSQAVESSVALEAAKPRLTIAADGAVAGFTGCNDLSGHAAVTGDKIAFTGITTTQKACDAEVTRIERTVLDTLHGSATYRIDGNQLALTNDADPGVGLRLRAN
ncbi:META domain-containing protein [Gordonia sp. FQ]|uniref:META domain-containing protein n=1 Tax=Gordonia sp. FQ TaxID=3446634 RepID=UPI003F8316EB